MTVVLVALAAVRLWWLVARDSITQIIRDELPDEVSDWLECPWCAGFWISAVVVLVAWAAGVVPIDTPAMYAIHVLGVSAVVGLVGEL